MTIDLQFIFSHRKNIFDYFKLKSEKDIVRMKTFAADCSFKMRYFLVLYNE